MLKAHAVQYMHHSSMCAGGGRCRRTGMQAHPPASLWSMPRHFDPMDASGMCMRTCVHEPACLQAAELESMRRAEEARLKAVSKEHEDLKKEQYK